jgi:hypothetical protein
MSSSIHFHLGVDGVCEDIQSELELLLDTNPAEYDAEIVSDKDFETHFKDVINSAGFVLGENKFDILGYASDTILFLRPKFLYFGQPLNSVDHTMRSAYKIETTLSLFPSSDLTFHLFLTDHATYLNSHLNWLQKTDLVPDFSWVPLVDVVAEQLGDRGKLMVWDAENPEAAMTKFAAFAFGAEPDDAHPFFASGEKTPLDHDRLEAKLADAGIGLDELDEVYETDLASFDHL